jgi:Cu(I)/Ag(I) efflux system periplasmic protein CusF
MNSTVRMFAVVAILLAAGTSIPVRAQTSPAAGAPGTAPLAVAPSGSMVDGEVRKVDKDAKKITLKHGEIPSLEMPPMTMVFQVRDAAMLGTVKAGDKVKFKAVKSTGGALVVTELEIVK